MTVSRRAFFRTATAFGVSAFATGFPQLTQAAVVQWRSRPSSVDLAGFGLSAANSGADNDRAIRKALAHAVKAASKGGVRFTCAAGHYKFALSTPWILPANVLFDLGGMPDTVWHRVDQSAVNWFETKNIAGNIGFRGARFIGNSRATVNGNGCFLFAELTAAASATMAGFTFDDLAFENFAGDGWLYFICRDGAKKDLSQIRIGDNCHFKSRPDNARGPNTREIWSSCMIFQGNYGTDGSSGRIRDVRVGQVKADIADVKSLAIVWGGTEDVVIDHPLVEACGTGAIGDDSGAYCIVVGNETVGAPNPDRIAIKGPRIRACRSVGVYYVAWGGTNIGKYVFDGRGGYINNVTDTKNGTLSKGAIASTDGPNEITIRNLTCDSVTSALDMRLWSGATLLADGVKASNIAAGKAGILIGGQSANKARTGDITLLNLDLSSKQKGTTGVRFLSNKHGYGDILIGGDINIDVTFIGISAYKESGRSPMDQFASLILTGDMHLRNAAAGQIVLQDNTSPITLDAEIESYRPTTHKLQDKRFKYDGSARLRRREIVRIQN